MKVVEQVGSSDNGIGTVKSSDDTEMIPASTSDSAAVEQNKEAEVATAKPTIQDSHPTPSHDLQRMEEVHKIILKSLLNFNLL